jgi:small subunit ribosomal protein S9
MGSMGKEPLMAQGDAAYRLQKMHETFEASVTKAFPSSLTAPGGALTSKESLLDVDPPPEGLPDLSSTASDPMTGLAPEAVGRRPPDIPPSEQRDFERMMMTDRRFLEAAGLHLMQDADKLEEATRGDAEMSKPIRSMPLWMLYEVAQSEMDSDEELLNPLKPEPKNARRTRPEPTIVRIPLRDALGRAWAVGRRKSSHALVSVQLGDGDFFVNHEPLAEYFQLVGSRQEAVAALAALRVCGAFDVHATVRGGGVSGQTGAVKLGVARALARFDPLLRPKLKALGLLHRDPRVVERKKPGQKKARKKFQWVKR